MSATYIVKDSPAAANEFATLAEAVAAAQAGDTIILDSSYVQVNSDTTVAKGGLIIENDDTANPINLKMADTGGTFALTITGSAVSNVRPTSTGNTTAYNVDAHASTVNNVLFGAQNDDTLTGGSGDDTLAARGGGGNHIDGGAGIDNLILGQNSFLPGTNNTIDLNQAVSTYNNGAATITNVEVLTIQGGGGLGDDTILTRADLNYRDVVDGNTGSDTIGIGQAGDGSTITDDQVSGYIYFDAEAPNSTDIDTLIGDYSRMTVGVVIKTDDGQGNLVAAPDSGILNTDKLDGGGGYITLAADTRPLAEFDNFERFNFTGGSGDDRFVGGAMADTFTGNAGNDTFSGAGGNDTVDYSREKTVAQVAQVGDVVVNLSAVSHTVNGHMVASGTAIDDFGDTDTLISIENVTTGGGNDTVFSSSAANVIQTGGGSDTIYAGAGDTVSAGDGNDLILINATDGQPASIDGGIGNDTVRITSGSMAVANTITHVENFEVSDGASADLSALTQGTNITLLSTTGGGATVTGTAGDDFITGGAGDDTIIVGSGADIMMAGDGNDTFRVSGAVSGLADFDGGDGVDTIVMGDAGVTNAYNFVNILTGVEDFTFEHTAGHTIAVVTDGGALAANTVISGASAGDTFTVTDTTASLNLSGWAFVSSTLDANAIVINGSTSANTIVGSSQSELITGGGGNDSIDGGGGTDTAVYAGNISDYSFVVQSPGVSGTLKITDSISNRDGVDTVTNVEKFIFNGVTYNYEGLFNHAPTVASGGPISITEDTAGPLSGITVGDVDSGGNTEVVTLSVPAGALSATSGSGVVVGGTATALTLTGTIADLNSFLAASVTYTPAANATGPVTLTVAIDDQGHTGADPGQTGTATSEAASTTATINIAPVNDAPALTVPGAQNVAEDSPLSIAGLSVSDIDAGSSDVSVNLAVAHGSITVLADVAGGLAAGGISGNSSGSVTLTGSQSAIDATLAAVNGVVYHNTPDYNGTDTLTVTADDGGNTGSGGALTDIKTVGITVTPVADIVADSLTTDEDTAITANLITGIGGANADSFEGSPVLTSVTQGAHGAVTFQANGSVTYTPVADYNGSDTFNYTVTSPAGVTETATVAVSVSPVADIVPDFLSTNEDTAITANLITGANADNFEGTPALTAVTQGAHGSVTFQADGSVTYTPVADYNGSDTFNYTVTSPAGVTETAAVTVTVNAVADIVADALTTTEDTAITANLITGVGGGSADNFEGSPVLTAVTQGTHGAVTFLANGSVTYTPVADYNGSDSFTYTVTSPAGVTETAAVTVNVTAAADIVADALTTNEDIAITANLITGTGGASADNFEGTPVLTAVTQGAHGAVTFLSNGSVTYTPVADYNGTDTFNYTVTSGGVTETAAVTVTVNPVNDAPVLVGLTTLLPSIDEDAVGASYTVEDIFAGHFSDDADQVANGSSANFFVGIAITGNASTPEQGKWQYLPSGQGLWTDVGAVSDGSALVLESTTQLRFVPAPNFNGTAPDGAAPPLTAHLIENSGGAITSGTTADLSTVGGTTQYSSGTVTLSENVVAVNDAPTASNLTQSLTLAEDATPPLLFTAAPVVADIDSANVTATLTLSDTAAGVLVGADSSVGGVYTITGSQAHVNSALAALKFDSAQDFNGSANVAVVISDGVTEGPQGTNPTGTVSITVTAVNDAPVNHVPGTQTSPTGDVVFSTANGNAISVTDVDIGGGAATATLSVLHGTLTLATTAGLIFTGDGTGTVHISSGLSDINAALNGLTYHATSNPFTGDTLTILSDDKGNSGSGGLLSDQDTVSITANLPPSVPIDTDGVNGTSGVVLEGAGAGTAVGITASSTDPEDGANVTYSLIDSAGGRFQINATTGVVTVSAAGATGIDYETAPGHGYTITVQAADTQGGTSTQDFVIGVTDAAPTVPVDSNAGTNTVSEGASNGDSVGITAASTDVNGGGVTYSLTDDAGGRFSIDSAGVVHVADATLLNYENATSHSITVKAADAGGAFNTQTFTIAVTNVAPFDTADSYGTAEDTALTVNAASGVLANDSDVHGGNITAVLESGPAHAGSFGLNADGSFHYTPGADFNGADSFSYHAFDGTSAGNSITVSLAVSEVNDAPVANPDTLPTIAEDAGVQTIAFAALTGNDATGPANEGGQALAVTGVGNAAGGTVQINGGHVEFTPTPDYNGAASFDYTIQDDGTTGGNPDAKTATGHASFTITAVNDAPNATNLTQSLSLAEDAGPVQLFAQAPVVSDVDSATVTATLTLSNAAAGMLIGADSSTGNVYTVSGSQAHVNAALAALSYDPAQDFNGSASVTVAIDDGHNGPQGANPAGTISIAVAAVNDAPVNTLPIGFLTTGSTDHALTGLSVSDVDATSISTTLHVDHGTLVVAAAGGATVGGSGTDTVTLSGSVAQVDAALSASNNVLYHSTASFTGIDHLTMTSSDGGGTGSGGVLTDTDMASISVSSSQGGAPGAFDFNFDIVGKGDSGVLLQNDNGGISVWDNGLPADSHTFATSMPSDWHLAGIGDFDGNGKSDFLWQNDSGSVAIWDNGQIGHTVAGSGSVPANMHVVGTGDFDGNGKTDILWQDTSTGAVSIWNSGLPSNLSAIASSMPSSWHVAGVGDFDGNGKSDILWQNDNGSVAIWDNGQLGHTIATSVPASWHIAGVGDFNGDHKSDILWHNDNGSVAIWDSAQVGHTVAAAGTVTSDWHIIG